jgi:hypothetical protein
MENSAIRQQLRAQLIEKAWNDPEFKAKVVRDPKGMLEQYLGKALPQDVKIYVHEEDNNTLHFSIPPTPSKMAELSDDDLAKVAGGTEIWASELVISLAIGTAIGTAGAGVSAGVSAAVGGGLAGGGVQSPW